MASTEATSLLASRAPNFGATSVASPASTGASRVLVSPTASVGNDGSATPGQTCHQRPQSSVATANPPMVPPVSTNDESMKAQESLEEKLFEAVKRENHLEVEQLLVEGANTDVQIDNEHVLQLAEGSPNRIKQRLRDESTLRVAHPVHVIARSGEIDAFNHWLEETLWKRPGVAQTWTIRRHSRGGEDFEVTLQLRLVRDDGLQRFNLVSNDAAVPLSGYLHPGNQDLQLKIPTAGGGESHSYVGKAQSYSTGQWTGDWSSGVKKTVEGSFDCSMAMYECVKKCKLKWMVQGVCFTCDADVSERWNGAVGSDPRKESLVVSARAEDTACRLMWSGYQCGYRLSGTWQAGRIRLAKYSGRGVEKYDGTLDVATGDWGDWSGTKTCAAVPTTDFRFSVPMAECGCRAKIIRNAGKVVACVECARQYNWCSPNIKLRLVAGRATSLKPRNPETPGRDETLFQLVGCGLVDNEYVDVFGSWSGDERDAVLFKCVKARGTPIEYSVTLEFSDVTGTAQGRVEGSATPLFKDVPFFKCSRCNDAKILTPNDLCLNCAAESHRNANAETLTGKVQYWTGQCREGSSTWEDDCFFVQVIADVENSYRLVGYGNDDMGPFTCDGKLSATNFIELTRWYAHGQVITMTGQWANSIWEGDWTGAGSSGRLRYSVPAPQVATSNPSTGVATSAPTEEFLETWKMVATALNKKDAMGRTALMYAALSGNWAVASAMLPFLSQSDVRTNDNNGDSAMDLLLRRSFRRGNAQANADLLEFVRTLHLHAGLDLHPSAIPSMYGADSKGATLVELAKAKHWTTVDTRLKSGDEDWADVRAVGHLACREGQVATLKAVLDHPGFDMDAKDQMGQYMLHNAAVCGKTECVNVLLDEGVPPGHVDAHESDENKLKDVKKDAAFYPRLEDAMKMSADEELFLYCRAGVPSYSDAKQFLKAKQTALHAAILLGRSERVVEYLGEHGLVDINAQDSQGMTPLMLATVKKDVTAINVLVRLGADVDAATPVVDKDGVKSGGRTALMMAALGGDQTVVDLLLDDHLADVKAMDAEGKTCVDLLESVEPTVDRSELKDRLAKECKAQTNSPAVVAKLSQRLMETLDEFDADVFHRAVNLDPAVARLCLDRFVRINRHDVDFPGLETIFQEDAKRSVLDAILHLDVTDEDSVEKARTLCVQHPVVRRVLDIKWELFGQRLYFQQLLLYLMLVITMSVSFIVHEDDSKNVSAVFGLPVPVYGLAGIIFSATGLVLLQVLEPVMLWRTTRYFFHDWSTSIEPHVTIPDLAAKKTRTRQLLVAVQVVATALLLAVVLLLPRDAWFAVVNNCLLVASALYFLHTEYQEMRATGAKYIESTFNLAQVAVYVAIAFVYVPMQAFSAYGVQFDEDFQRVLGGCITLVLWVLSLQFVEIIESASAMLPMMSRLATDIWNFFIVFCVFQGGFTITFYHLFRHQNEDAFGTLASSFVTTYFVAFGENPVDALQSIDSTKEGGLRTVATGLVMAHAAVVAFILLNLLMAMMNKTVERGFDQAQLAAAARYAKCVWRLEGSMNLTAAQKDALTRLDLGDLQNTPALNPVVTESVPMHRVDENHKTTIVEFQTANDECDRLMKELDKITDDVVAGVQQKLGKMLPIALDDQPKQAADVFEKDAGLVEVARKRIKSEIKRAKSSCGQNRAVVLEKLRAAVAKNWSALEFSLDWEWQAKQQSADHSKLVLLHELTCKPTLLELVGSLKTTLLARIDQAIQGSVDKAKSLE